MKPAREPASSRPKPRASLKKPHGSCRFAAPCGPRRKKMIVVRHQLVLQKPPGSRLWFSRTGVQPSPGSSTIELPSAFAESGAYPPDRELPGSPRQCSLPLACRHSPEGYQNWSSEEAHTWEHHPQATVPPPRLNRQAEPRRQAVDCLAQGRVRPYNRRKDHPTHIPRNQVSEGEGTRRIIKCQPHSWSQRVTEVNGSHYGDPPTAKSNTDPNRDKKLCGTKSNGIDQCQNGYFESNLHRLELLIKKTITLCKNVSLSGRYKIEGF